MTKDGKISILIDVDAKQVPNVISSIEKNFGQLGKNADDITKKIGNNMGANTETGAKVANQAVDSVEQSMTDLGRSTDTATAKAGKSLSENFEVGSKAANTATDSVVKGVADLTATTSTELAKSGRIMGESFDSGAKDANQANDSVVKSVTSLVSSVESSAPKIGKELGGSFQSGAKEATSALDGIGKSSSNMLASIEATSPKAGRSIGNSFEAGSKQAASALGSIEKSSAQMVPPVELSATKAGKSIATSLEAGSKDGAKTVSDAVDAMKKDLMSLGDEAEKSGAKMSTSFSQPEPKANLLTGSVGKLSAAMLIAKGATTALSMAKGSLDGAFGRIDTLNNFENTMTRLTGSSEEAAAGMEGVRDAVVGTNYMLDSAAQTVQRLVMQNGSLEQSTKSYQIWGDAVAMYGDGAAETMDNVMDAMIQMRATGTVNMAQMDRMVRRGVDPWEIYADATGMSMQSIRDALRAGEISANQFFDTVEQAMRDGGNEFTSVSGMAQQAGDTWAGSFANMATATSRGTANIIESMDEAFGKTRFGSMKENVQGFGKTFEGVLNSVAGVVPPVVSAIDTMVGGMIDLKESSVILAPAIIGVTTAIAGYMVIKKAELYTRGFIASIKTLTGAKTADTAVTKAMTVAEKSHLSEAARAKAMTAGSTAATNLHTIAIKAKTIATAALKMATSGVGLAMGAAAALGAILFKSWNDNRKAAKELASELDGLKDDLDSVGKSTQSSAKEFESQAKVIESNTERNKDLAAELQRLSAIEDKSAADKKLMADTVDELNNSVTGLNLSYDEETGLLNATTEEINKRIEASKGMEEVNRLTERQKTLNQEAADIESSLTEVAKERMRLEQEASESGVDGKKKVKESLEGLSQKEDELQSLLVENQSERNQLYTEEQEKRRAVAETVSEANSQMITSWNVLSDAQQAALESMNSMYKKLVEESGNAFKQIEQQEAISLDQMKENLQKNAEAMRTWSTNVAILAKVGVDDGIIMQLEKLGPAGALQTQQMVDEMGLNLSSLAELGGEHTKNLLEKMGLHMEDLPKMSAEQSAWFVENLDLELGKLPETAQQHISDLNGTADVTMKQAMASMGNIVGEETETVAEKFGLIPEKSEASLRRGTEGRDFAQWGRQPVEEIGDGMVEATPKVEEAAKEVAQTPERVMGPQLEQTDYASMGAAPPTKLGQGILDNITSVEEASKEVAQTPETMFQETIQANRYIPTGQETGKGLSEGINQSNADVELAAKAIGMIPENTIQAEMTTEKTKESGTEVGRGIAQGIDSSQEAVQQSAKAVADTPNNELSSHMNQGIYAEYGQAVGEGLATGIADTSPVVVAEVNKLVDQMVKQTDIGIKNMTVSFNQVVPNVANALSALPMVASNSMNSMNMSFQSGSQVQLATVKALNSNLIRTFTNTPSEFQSIGRNIMSRLNSGMMAESSRVVATSRNISNRIVQSFNQLPNQMQMTGRNAISSLNSGMNSSVSQPILTASRTSSAVVSAFSGLSNQLNGVGRDAMAGLNAGLNAGTASVLATANRIANQVAATMKSALDINSPSKVMANEVGRWIPEGVAAGIEKYAGVVYQEIDNLSAGMLKITTPEVALGSARMWRELSNEKISQTIVHQSPSVDMAELARVLNSRPIKVNSILDGEKISSTFDQSLGRQMYKRQYTGGVGFA
ncbi:hypothetical protein IGJ19_002423 [Enterococcus sp. DIV1368b]|uniref:tape measure protein n=1 Tax=Enterococcus sp. DIV1368b TaxID=2774711 RepID=UPI003D2FD07F